MALACPVCFGQNDSPMANAMNAGILLMLGVVVMILTGFGYFIYYLSRRASVVGLSSSSAIHAQAEVVPQMRPHPQEGTAQC